MELKQSQLLYDGIFYVLHVLGKGSYPVVHYSSYRLLGDFFIFF